jgi:hypothetical protein
VSALELLTESGEVGLGHAEQVADHQVDEGIGELADELALALGDELVDLAIRESAH